MTPDEKLCPDCAETVKAAARKCKHCGYAFAPALPEPSPIPTTSAPLAPPVIEAWQVTDLLSHLVGKSLVVYEEDENGHGRYRLLETVRQYSRDRLLESGGEGIALRDRHLRFLLALSERAGPQLRGRQQMQWLDRLEIEHDNLRAALEWALVRDGERALRLAGALLFLWLYRGHLTEGRRWLTAALSTGEDGVSAEARLGALVGASFLAYGQGDYVALSLLAAECLALARTSGEPRDLALALLMPALEAAVRGDQGSASSLSQECARAAREARDPWLLAWALLVHGNEAQASGDDQRARLLFTQGLIPAEESGDRWVRGILRCNVASLELRQGRAGRASALYKQALAAFREMGERTLVANAVEGLAGVAACRGCPERAARLLGAMAAYRETIGYPVEALERPHYERQLAACRCALGEAAFAAAFAEGRAMPLERAVEHALEEA